MIYQERLQKSDLFYGLNIAHLKFYGLWDGINDYRSTRKTSRMFKLNMTLSTLYVFPYVDQCDLVDLLRVDFLSSIPDSKRHHVNSIYQQNAFRCNIFTVLAFTGNVLTIITWTILPGFDTEKTGTGRKKILSGWYPVPYSESPWYEIVFGYEVILICWHGSLVSLYESFLLILLVALYSHFIVLGYHTSTLNKNYKGLIKTKDDATNNIAFNMELRKILLDYNKLLSDALSTFKLMMYFSFALIEITLLCVSSSFVESASMAIQDSVYSSDWYSADKAFATTAQMIMIRAKRPVTLTALKMYPVNMETMIAIFRFIYSAVAVLSKMKE
ncbi:unnamed protein product [Nezara viridula]|uniref:Odorant receptor n=1 Tax=Nezara viridula TaxID=85310 RepID=A0A9P0HDG8_NEZVI|nr:unnamed protein product [Nezara viridula]